MNIKYLALVIGLLTVVNISFAKKRTYKAHVHGDGKFNLVVDKKNIEVEFEIPADSIVGFEHKPKTKQQKNNLKLAMLKLKNVNEIILLPKKGNCKAKDVRVETALTGENKIHDGHEHDESHNDKISNETHSEFNIIYKIKCEAPKHLRSITLSIFKHFPRLQQLKGQAVTNNGQFSQQLNLKNNKFSLSE